MEGGGVREGMDRGKENRVRARNRRKGEKGYGRKTENEIKGDVEGRTLKETGKEGSKKEK